MRKQRNETISDVSAMNPMKGPGTMNPVGTGTKAQGGSTTYVGPMSTLVAELRHGAVWRSSVGRIYPTELAAHSNTTLLVSSRGMSFKPTEVAGLCSKEETAGSFR